jgi:hypothetical protein
VKPELVAQFQSALAGSYTIERTRPAGLDWIAPVTCASVTVVPGGTFTASPGSAPG